MTIYIANHLINKRINFYLDLMKIDTLDKAKIWTKKTKNTFTKLEDLKIGDIFEEHCRVERSTLYRVVKITPKSIMAKICTVEEYNFLDERQKNQSYIRYKNSNDLGMRPRRWKINSYHRVKVYDPKKPIMIKV